MNKANWPRLQGRGFRAGDWPQIHLTAGPVPRAGEGGDEEGG